MLVKSEEVCDDLGAIKRKLLRGEDELHILLWVGVWQERLKVFLHQLLIEPHVVMPFGCKDKRQRKVPICDIFGSELGNDDYFFVPNTFLHNYKYLNMNLSVQ